MHIYNTFVRNKLNIMFLWIVKFMYKYHNYDIHNWISIISIYYCKNLSLSINQKYEIKSKIKWTLN